MIKKPEHKKVPARQAASAQSGCSPARAVSEDQSAPKQTGFRTPEGIDTRERAHAADADVRSGSLNRAEAAVLRVADIELDRAAHLAMRGMREIYLDPVEFRLLAYMMENSGRLLARAELIEAGWTKDRAVDSTTLTTYICRLRRALNRGKEKDPIRTVRGMGYVFGSRRES